MPFERIKALEVTMTTIQGDVSELKEDVKAIKSIVTEGRGAARLAKILLFAAGVIGGGVVGHEKMSEFLKWLGS